MAVNRAPSGSHSEGTGITQTSRNFGASLGLAVLGTIFTSRNKANVTSALTSHGVPKSVAEKIGASFGSAGASSHRSGELHAIVHAVQLANAPSTQTVFYITAAVMVATFTVAVRRLPSGRVEPREILEHPAPDPRRSPPPAEVGPAAEPK